MYLTKEEEKILEGEEGPVAQLAMKVIVKVGEVLGAERLVKVKSAHVSGISYKNIGEAGLELLKSIYDQGGKVRCKTTINPSSIDEKKWRSLGIPEHYAEKQLQLVDYLEKMGAERLLSCTPYYYQELRLGDQLAWAESNAVLYANSVIGARTPREGGPLALFEALVGKAPLVDLRLENNRKPTVLIRIDEKVLEELRDEKIPPSLLGFAVGHIVGKGVPYVETVIPFKSREEIRDFLAGVGASSSIGLVILNGVSPEASKADISEVREKLEIGTEEIEECLSKISVSDDIGKLGVAFMGCPHLSQRELVQLKGILQPSTVIRKTFLCTCRRAVKNVGDYSSRNLIILSDMCLVVAPHEYLNFEYILTDSAKAAYYLTSKGLKVKLVPRRELLRWCAGKS